MSLLSNKRKYELIRFLKIKKKDRIFILSNLRAFSFLVLINLIYE